MNVREVEWQERFDFRHTSIEQCLRLLVVEAHVFSQDTLRIVAEGRHRVAVAGGRVAELDWQTGAEIYAQAVVADGLPEPAGFKLRVGEVVPTRLHRIARDPDRLERIRCLPVRERRGPFAERVTQFVFVLLATVVRSESLRSRHPLVGQTGCQLPTSTSGDLPDFRGP